MILQTMTDEEKAFEAFCVYETALNIYKEHKDKIWDKFERGTRFPYFQRIQFVDGRNNKWMLTFLCKTKKMAKKGQFWCSCYTVYEIQKKDRRYGTNMVDGNTGKGVLMIDPFAMKSRVNKTNKGLGMVVDIVPHAFNRYTDRYLKPKGLQNIEFERKVESIMLRWKYFDVSGDKASENNKEKGMSPYDVFMDGGGILRGYIVDEILMRFFSYVSDDMMYKDQKKWQDEMNTEYTKWIASNGHGVTKIRDI